MYGTTDILVRSDTMRQRRCPHLLKEPLWQYPFRKPFEKMWVDAKSVQKTPAGVLIVRRGLFFC
jgi:hypothetical protein